MMARDYFESLRLSVLEVAAMEASVADLNESSRSPKAQGSSPGSGKGRANVQPIADRAIDAERELDKAKARIAPQLERATDVLYGRSGRGGVARELGSAEADAVFGYYVYGMSWPQVADELVQPNSKDGAHWCRNRASAALRHIDEVGMAYLAST